MTFKLFVFSCKKNTIKDQKKLLNKYTIPTFFSVITSVPFYEILMSSYVWALPRHIQFVSVLSRFTWLLDMESRTF